MGLPVQAGTPERISSHDLQLIVRLRLVRLSKKQPQLYGFGTNLVPIYTHRIQTSNILADWAVSCEVF